VNKTPLKHKLLLFLFSLIVTFFILEIFLRLGGFIFSFQQNQTNQMDPSQDHYRILCIGESTTALGGDDSYPSQLEKILNQTHGTKKFKVINKGLVSKTTQDILEQLPDFLRRYRPHIVVGMMGVNDRHLLFQKNSWVNKLDNFMQHSRVYGFLQLLCMHVQHKIRFIEWKDKGQLPGPSGDLSSKRDWIEFGPDAPAEINKTIESYVSMEMHEARLRDALGRLRSEQARARVKEVVGELRIRQAWVLVAIGRYHRQRGEVRKAFSALARSLVQQPGNFGSFIEMGRCYKDMGQYRKAITFFYQAHQIKAQALLPLIEMRRCYELLNMEKEVYEISQEILKRDTEDFPVLPEVGDWLKEHEYYEEAEESFLKAIEKNPYDYTLYEDLAEVYSQVGEAGKADMYHSQAVLREEKLVEYPAMTIRNYNKIISLVNLSASRMICMQYPLRSLDLLKKIIRPHHDVIFVDNKENFERALKHSQYSEYFSDFFGGDFGHCTRAGNRLIAENLADTILKIIPSAPSIENDAEQKKGSYE